MSLTTLSVCSGIGGMELGLVAANLENEIKCQEQIEIDPFCQSVLIKRFNLPLWGDLRSYTIPFPGRFDIIAGGIPCQPYSLSGKRLGNQDDRDLSREFVRLLKEGQPKAFILENVPGLLSIARGQHFKEFSTAIEKAGYDWTYKVLSAAEMGAVHIRKRVWLTGYHKDLKISLPAPIKKSFVPPNTYFPTPKASDDIHPGVRFCKPGQTQHLSCVLYKGLEGTGWRLNPDFIAPMMGYPCGWLQDCEVVKTPLLTHDNLKHWWDMRMDREKKSDRRYQLKAFGNAIVPQVAAKVWNEVYQNLTS